MGQDIKVLLIEDDPAYALMIEEVLSHVQESRFQVETADTLSAGLERLKAGGIDICLLDLALSDSSGLDTFVKTHSSNPHVPIVVLSGLDDETLALEAVARGAQDYLVKGEVDSKLLVRTARYAIERKRAEEILKRRSEALAALNNAGQALTSTLDLDKVLAQAMSEARAMLSAEAASVILHDPTTDELVFAASDGPGSEDLLGARMPAEAGIAGWTLREAQPLLIKDAQEDPRFYADIDTATGMTTRSLLAVPLKYKDRVIGVIEAINRSNRHFDEHDLEILSILAGSAAIAIENARLYEAEREQRILVEQSHAQLVQSEKLAATGRLAASLAHEINNPLQAIHTSLQLMISFDVEPEEQQEYIRMADEEVKRLIDIATSVLDFARPSRPQMESIYVDEVIEGTLALANKYLQHSHIAVKQDLASDLPPVMAVPGELRQVLLNLVINAVDSMPGGGTLAVSSFQVDDGQQGVSISDTGRGIPPEHLDRIFEPFFSTKESGTGLGLSVSYNVIQAHGGEITVQSQVDIGSTFTVLLPSATES
jgi:signal transduction histidine kinase/DNA-binding response OmpR family regulator